MAPLLLTLLALSLIGPSSFLTLARAQAPAPAAGVDLKAAAGAARAVVNAVAAGVSTVTGKKWNKPKVSDQGAAFCSNLVQSINYCPRVPPVINLNLNAFSGMWYLVATNAQNVFDLFSLQGGQCATTDFEPIGKYRGRSFASVTNKALVYANPLREVESITVSQNAQTIGLGVRYLCQFLVGQDPLSTVIPELKLLVNASSRVAKLADLKAVFSTAYAQAVSSVTGNDPLLTEWVNAAITPVVDNQAKKFASSNAFLSNPVTGAGLNMLSSYASAAEQALDQTVTVKGLSNAIQLGSIFSAMRATAKGRVGMWSATIVAGVNIISMYSEAVYAALERIQRSNLALSGGNWPTIVAANQTALDIITQTDRIQWLGRRMHAERRSCFRAAMRIEPKIETNAQLLQAAGAVKALAKDGGPMQVAIDQVISSAGDIAATVADLGPGFGLPRRIKRVGKAAQSPVYKGKFDVTFGQKMDPYNIVKITGVPALGYDVALAFGCDASYTSGFLPQNSFYLLSRQPDPPRSVINSTLNYLRDNGIVLAGDNELLYMSHDSGRCHPFFELP